MWLSSLEITRRSFAPLQKSRRHNRSRVWTEALSGMIFVPAQKLSGIHTHYTLFHAHHFAISARKLQKLDEAGGEERLQQS